MAPIAAWIGALGSITLETSAINRQLSECRLHSIACGRELFRLWRSQRHYGPVLRIVTIFPVDGLGKHRNKRLGAFHAGPNLDHEMRFVDELDVCSQPPDSFPGDFRRGGPARTAAEYSGGCVHSHLLLSAEDGVSRRIRSASSRRWERGAGRGARPRVFRARSPGALGGSRSPRQPPDCRDAPPSRGESSRFHVRAYPRHGP